MRACTDHLLSLLSIPALLTGLAVCVGCAHSLRPYNAPSRQKLRVESVSTDNLIIRVAGATNYPVPPDGRVTIEVPPLERGCAWYLFGFIKVKDHSPYDVKAIHIVNGRKVLSKLSLNQITKLPVDDAGYPLIKIR